MKEEDTVYSFVNRMHVEFVKQQDEFIRKECIKHLSENEQATILYINEDILNHIFDLGLKEYIKELEKRNERS